MSTTLQIAHLLEAANTVVCKVECVQIDVRTEGTVYHFNLVVGQVQFLQGS